MAEPEASPLRGAGASSGSGRGLTEDPGLGAAAGLSTLSLSHLLSTLSTRRRGLWCSGCSSRSCRSAFPSFPPRQIPEFARHGFTHCGRPALGSQGEQLWEGARGPRVGLRRLQALQRGVSLPYPDAPPRALKGPCSWLVASPLWGSQDHVLRWPSAPGGEESPARPRRAVLGGWRARTLQTPACLGWKSHVKKGSCQWRT